MKNQKRIVVITGSNRGLGFAMAEKLLQEQSDKFHIIMTARDKGKGLTSYNKLKYSNPDSGLDFHTLDIDNEDSQQRFFEHVSETYGKIDVLINNAGTHDKFYTKDYPKFIDPLKQNNTSSSSSNSNSENQGLTLDPESKYMPTVGIAEKVIRTNYTGTVSFTTKMWPLLTKDAKVIMMSSRNGKLDQQSKEIQKCLNDPNMKKERLDQLASDFIRCCMLQSPDQKENQQPPQMVQEKAKWTWSKSAYNASKVLLNTWCRFEGKNLLKENQNIFVITPGRVRTQMGGQDAPRTTEEGIKFITKLIGEVPFEKNNDWNLKFLADGEVIDW